MKKKGKKRKWSARHLSVRAALALNVRSFFLSHSVYYLSFLSAHKMTTTVDRWSSMFIAARYSVSAIFAIRLSSCCCCCWGSNEHRERANSKKPLAAGQQLPLAHQRELFICFSQLPLLCFACLECNLLFTVSSYAGTRPNDNRVAVQRNDSNENAQTCSTRIRRTKWLWCPSALAPAHASTAVLCYIFLLLLFCVHQVIKCDGGCRLLLLLQIFFYFHILFSCYFSFFWLIIVSLVFVLFFFVFVSVI